MNRIIPSSAASYNCDGWRAQISLRAWPQFCAASVGNAIPQGASVGRPHNSALTKFAIRPKNNPKQLLEAIKSPTDHGLHFVFLQ